MKKMFKTRISCLLCAVILAASSVGCSNGNGTSANPTSGGNGASSAKPSKITFWYHDGNATSNAVFGELIKRFEKANPQYTVEYVGLPSDSYLQKYNTAIATNSVPDVASIRDMDMSSFISQGSLKPLDDTFNSWSEKSNILTAVLNTVRSAAPDKKLYCLPESVTMDVSWYNSSLLKKNGIKPPKTQDEFLEDCKKFADPANGKYFYSLRGGAGSLENLFDFLFTYAGEESLFDKDGNCVLNKDKFAEGLEKYASIYWNGWTSKDSVTNDFKKIVAEFGSGTSMYLSHNSSSLPEHQKNLGEGNFANVVAPANSDGITVTKDLSFIGFGVFSQAKNPEGGAALAKFLASADAASYDCEKEGRVPVNTGVYDDDWCKASPYMQVYQKMMQDSKVKWLAHPIWLPTWNEFRSKLQEPDLQAVLLKQKKAKDVLNSWAEYLTKAQKEYLAKKSK